VPQEEPRDKLPGKSLDNKDENSAPEQADEKVHVTGADRALGIPGAEPPFESKPARVGKRDLSAAGLTSIWETTRRGIREMGVKRSLHTLTRINQKDGFDCPSCAWPDPDGERKAAEFCENGAKAVASEATTARATPEFFTKHAISALLRQSDLWLDKQGRITHPLLRRSGADHYEAISWEEAFAIIGRELNALASPDEAVFYTSGRASNEAAFLYQLFVRQFGTNNLPDCSNMCHESSGLGLTETIGIGKATVKIEDFSYADSIFIIGQNPGTCHPRMLTELQTAARNGCKIVSVNPLPESGLIRFKNPQEPLSLLGTGTALACLFLPVRVNGDVALLKAIMKDMVERDRQSGGKLLAHDFIEHHTEGFDAFVRDLDGTPWDETLEASGVSRELVREAADIALASERMICCWAMGITQHENGVGNVQTIVDFALLRGQIGRRGAGLCPVRGHSNVQGDRTVGIWEKMSDKFMKSLGQEFNFTPPKQHGLDTVRAIQAMHERRAKVFVGLGGNFLSATPDTHYTSEAMARCRLTVQISTKLNRGHLITGEQALILPCLGRTERDVQRRAVRHRRGHDRGRASVTRRAGPRVGAPAQRAGDRRGHGAGHAPRPDHRRLAGVDRRLRSRPRPHRARRAGIRAVQPARSRAGGLLSAQWSARRHVPDAVGPRALHRSPHRRASPQRGPAPADHPAQPRSVQHDDLRRQRSVPRHLRRPARDLPQRRRHARA
jgi:molybdopterin-dependent oxidoreductase alpha subunit